MKVSLVSGFSFRWTQEDKDIAHLSQLSRQTERGTRSFILHLSLLVYADFESSKVMLRGSNMNTVKVAVDEAHVIMNLDNLFVIAQDNEIMTE